MKHLTIIITSILIALCININAQEPNYPKVTVDGKTYYEYTVIAGDGLYSISRRFGISPKELNASNPDLTAEIKPGQKILIPCKEEIKEKTDSEEKIHIVEAKQTLYAISKLYNVSIDSLIKLNPEARQGIRAGDKLYIAKGNTQQSVRKETTQDSQKINSKKEDVSKNSGNANSADKANPTDKANLAGNNKTNGNGNFIQHVVEKKETLYAISRKYKVSIEEIISLNPEIRDGLKAGMTINIPTNKNTTDVPAEKNNARKQEETTLPQEIETQEINGNNQNYNSFEKTSSDINIAYILPFGNADTKDVNQRFIEFYRGSMIAMKSAKEKGYNAHIFTYNTKGNSQTIDSILSLPEIRTMDVIIGPAFTEELGSLLSFSKANNITTLVPFSSKIDEKYYYPRLLQFNPTENNIAEAITNNKIFNDENTKYIYVEYENSINKGSVICNKIKEIQKTKNLQYTTLKANSDIDSLIIAESENSKKVLVVFGSSNKNEVSHTISKLKLANRSNIFIWGYDNWESDLTLYPRTYYATLFDPNSTENYNLQYKEWFGPHLLTGYTKYDLIGYDLTTFVLQGLTINSDKSFFIKELPESTFYQSHPEFKFVNDRYLNTRIYMFYWDGKYLNEIK